MRNLFFLFVGTFLSIFIFSCTESEFNTSTETLTKEELVDLSSTIENSDEMKELRILNEAFIEDLRAEKVELYALFDAIQDKGLSLECESFTTFHSRLKGYDILKDYVCAYDELKLALDEKFEILEDLNSDQIEVVARGDESIASEDEVDCGDVFLLSLEFYDLETAIWAYYECCKDEYIIGCL